MPRNPRISTLRACRPEAGEDKKIGPLSRGKPSNSCRRSRGSGLQKVLAAAVSLSSGDRTLAGLSLGLLLLYHLLLTSSYFYIKISGTSESPEPGGSRRKSFCTWPI